MIRCITVLCVLLMHLGVYAQKPTNYYLKIKTSQGEAILKLYNETPLHRDNFYKLAKEKYYDSLMFHRVIQHFMIQGGDPNSRYAAEGVQLGNGGPEYRVPAEFRADLIHKKGTIGAARDNNPEKQSSGSQFYLVQGRKYSSAGLDSLEQFRLKGQKLSDLQRETYMKVGGTPHLDGAYTVFGELLSGLDVLDRVAAVKTDQRDRPLVNERMAIVPLTRREALNLEREAKGLKPKTGFFTRMLDGVRAQYYKL